MTTDLPPATDGQQSSIRRRERIEAILAEWQARWPAVFTKSVPLAIGISRCIKEQLSGQFPKRDIGITLHYWTNRNSYLRAVARGVPRRNLDGSEAGVPTTEVQEEAKRLLEERDRRQQERIQQRRART